jgi:hypothetical protein
VRLRPTHALGAVAVGGTVLAAAFEYAHVWRRGHAPAPRRGHVLESGRIAAHETVEVALEGYRTASKRENTLLNLLLSFSTTFGLARATTYAIRRWGDIGPLGNLHLGERHIHHLVPGIVICLVTGTATLLTGDEDLERWLALPFGAGAALTLDEAALLIELEDVYWTEEGIVSVQVALAAMALLAGAELTRRVIRRGEERVLPPTGRGPATGASLATGSASGGLAASGAGASALPT